MIFFSYPESPAQAANVLDPIDRPDATFGNCNIEHFLLNLGIIHSNEFFIVLDYF